MFRCSGARAVRVEYEELPSIITIDEAMAAESYFTDHGHDIVDGDVEVPLRLNRSNSSSLWLHQGDVQVRWAMRRARGDACGWTGSLFSIQSQMSQMYGFQEHFYMEPNVTLAVPEEGGQELVV